MDSATLDRFLEYRRKLFALIERALKRDGHCKSYEGRLELHFPCYFDDANEGYLIRLACYVLGPLRSYDYSGRSWEQCLDKAEKDLEAFAYQEFECLEQEQEPPQ